MPESKRFAGRDNACLIGGVAGKHTCSRMLDLVVTGATTHT